MVFTHDMADWLSFNVDEAWLAENIAWKDFGTGVRLGCLLYTSPSPRDGW